MGKRSTPRHGRSRKRRPATPSGAEHPPAAQPERRPAKVAASRSGAYRDPLSVGERPRAPWHPLPLSELLILVGAIGTIVAYRSGIAGNAALLIASLVAVALGTVEVTFREHSSGYRSHTLMLALLPTVAFHSVAILTLAEVITVPRWANLVLLLLDGALFAFLFRVLRARFVDARRERTFATRR